MPTVSSLIPLFDRLNADSDATALGATPDVARLSGSLRSESMSLLGARNRCTIDEFLKNGPTVLDYGLPDISMLSPQSATDLHRLELVILRAITLYEPRLIQVRIKAKRDPARPTAAMVTISALARLNRQLSPVHFDMALDSQGVHTLEPQP